MTVILALGRKGKTLSSKVTYFCNLQIIVFDYFKLLEQPVDGELAREKLVRIFVITKGFMCVLACYFFFLFLHKCRAILNYTDLLE